MCCYLILYYPGMVIFFNCKIYRINVFPFRFDLIFLMLDPQNEIFDRRLAFHLVSLYYKTKQLEEDEILVSLWNISPEKKYFFATLTK